MGVRCSLLGHSWNRREERSERGSNTVVDLVIRECARCDTEETIKERKHVSIAEAEATMTNNNSTDDSEPIAEFDEDELDDDETPSPSGDDALIIDGGDSSSSEETVSDSEGDAERNAETAHSSGTDGFVQRDPETNEEKGAEFDSNAFNGNPNAAPEAESSQPSGGSIIDGKLERGESSDESTSVPNGTEKLSCPNCGFAESAPESSRREGDGCPECRREYLELN